jgi:hypothetical protein
MVDHARRSARRRSRVGIAVASVLIAALALGACEEQRDDSALTEGLLLLSGEIGDVTLTLRDAGDPRGRELALPEPAAAWVSAGRTNVLLATLIDGRTFVSNSLGEDDPTWRLVEAVTVDDQPPEPPLYFGSWDPPGGAYVQLGADFAAGDGLRVVVTDPALEGATVAALAETRPLPAPPAWIDDDRVAVVAATADSTETVIVDTPSGDTEPGPAGVRLVATSADAAVAAVWPGPGSPVGVLATEAWLAGQTASVRIDPPEAGWSPAVLALDRPGERLAVVWTDGDGNPTRVTVHAGTREWRTIAIIPLDDVGAASVAWIR